MIQESSRPADARLRGMIRNMTPMDETAIQRVLAAAPEAAQWPPTELQGEPSPGSGFGFVAEIEGEVVGLVRLRVVADEAEVLNLAVAPPHRRKGFGRELLKTALESARKAGAKTMFLEVRATNKDALALYAAMGFFSSLLRRDYYRGPREDALVLSKVLG